MQASGDEVEADEAVFCVERAKSGRGKCHDRRCRLAIDKAHLRMGKRYAIESVNTRGKFYPAYSWYHLDCARLFRGEIVSLDALKGFDQLGQQDREKVAAWFDATAPRSAYGGPTPRPTVVAHPRTAPASNATVFPSSPSPSRGPSPSPLVGFMRPPPSVGMSNSLSRVPAFRPSHASTRTDERMPADVVRQPEQGAEKDTETYGGWSESDLLRAMCDEIDSAPSFADAIAASAAATPQSVPTATKRRTIVVPPFDPHLFDAASQTGPLHRVCLDDLDRGDAETEQDRAPAIVPPCARESEGPTLNIECEDDTQDNGDKTQTTAVAKRPRTRCGDDDSDDTQERKREKGVKRPRRNKAKQDDPSAVGVDELAKRAQGTLWTCESCQRAFDGSAVPPRVHSAVLSVWRCLVCPKPEGPKKRTKIDDTLERQNVALTCDAGECRHAATERLQVLLQPHVTSSQCCAACGAKIKIQLRVAEVPLESLQRRRTLLQRAGADERLF